MRAFGFRPFGVQTPAGVWMSEGGCMKDKSADPLGQSVLTLLMLPFPKNKGEGTSPYPLRGGIYIAS